MRLEVSDVELRRWFNFHPDEAVDPQSLMDYIRRGSIYEKANRTDALKEFLFRQFEQQARR